MGNKIFKKKYESTCPLINERKLIVENNFSGMISGLCVINYKGKEYILILDLRGTINIYESEHLELVVSEKNSFGFQYYTYIGTLFSNYFVVVGKNNIKIFIFYKDNISYHIKILQKIDNNNLERYNYCFFSKAINYDRNLFREKDLYEMEQDKKKKTKLQNKVELIISSEKGIFLFSKKKETGDIININLDKKEEDNDFDIDDILEKWKQNPYKFDKEITILWNYDIIQINFKYLAGTIKNYLCFYSMETYELVTKFEVKVSEECDCVIYMLNEDLLCLGGEDSITLISIKNFEIMLVSLIKTKFKITEICILPDYNILIGMENNDGSDKHKEYFYQYKYSYSFNKLTNKIEHKLLKGTSKFLTKNNSNIMMRCLNNNRIVVAVEYKIIQIWE